MVEEIWKRVEAFYSQVPKTKPIQFKKHVFSKNQYFISNFGNLKNDYGLMSNNSINTHGYIHNKLISDKGERIYTRRHQIVLQTFIPRTQTEYEEDYKTIDHIDRNRTNNNLSNLRWATLKEQMANIDKTAIEIQMLLEPNKIYDELPGEIFKKIHPNLIDNHTEQSYYASTYGRIRTGESKTDGSIRYRVSQGEIRRGEDADNEDTYNRITINRKKYYVHVLVLNTFKFNPYVIKVVVNHKNGKKNDNRLENLEYSTFSQNTQHAFDNNLIKKRTMFRYGAVRKVNQFDMNDNLIKTFESAKEAAEELGFNVKNIQTCLNPKGKGKSSCGFKWAYAPNQ